MTKFTKNYPGKMMRIACKNCGEDMTTSMIDVNRTPKNTTCKSCREEEDIRKRRVRLL